MKDPQATIRDIALKLNISISTVSRAIRGVPEVNAETRRAVLELAEKLHYEPNRVAQSLRIKKTKTLGIIVPEIAMHFFSSAISGMQEYAASKGYSIMICQSMETLAIEKSNIHMLVSNRVDGLIISLSNETDNVEHLQHLIQKKLPIVMFDRVHPDLPVSKVVVDDHDGAVRAVDYLVQTGCRRIVHISGPPNLYITAQRRQGYIDGLKKNGIPFDESLIVPCDNMHRDVYQATTDAMALKPEAIFCMNDPIAIMVMQNLKEKGVRIPEDVSIVGFTNEPVSSFIEPSLTTVAQPSFELGRMAARLLIDQMESLEPFAPITEVVPTQLMIRNSTRRR